jgi:hypothetical protein
MFEDSVKIHLIEEVLKLDDRTVLKELEAILKRSKVKTKPRNASAKQRFLRELKGSIKEVALAKTGKIKLQSAKDFINEL